MKINCVNNISLITSIQDSDLIIHPDLLASLSYCLMKSGQLIRARLDELLAEYNLIAPHLGMLLVIRGSESINQLQLGEQLGVDKASMVKLIDALEKLNFVKRITDPEDRRAKLIHITKEGSKFADKIIKERTKIEEEFLAPFSKKDQELIRKLVPNILISFNNVSKSRKK